MAQLRRGLRFNAASILVAVACACGSKNAASDSADASGSEAGTDASTTAGSTAALTSSETGAGSSGAEASSEASSSGAATTGDAPDCEDSGLPYLANVGVDFGDWPPTGQDSLGDDAWDVDVACTYVGVSPMFTGVLLSCDDNGTEREVDFQYDFYPMTPLPPMEVGDPLLLRAHTGSGETWIVLSRASGEVLVLGIFGAPEATLADQSDYAPFEFAAATGLCPVDACIRQWGLDITVNATTTRVFEGPPVDIVGERDTPYRVLIEGLFEHTNEVDANCPVNETLAFVLVFGA